MIYDALVSPFIEFEFMRRALVGCLALSLAAGPVGTFLMLRRMSLFGDAMAHAILPGAALGYLAFGLSLSAMTVGGLATGLLVVLLAGLVTRTTTLREDASIAGFYLISLALGVSIVSLKGSNVDLLRVLFGSILALDDSAMILLAAMSTGTLLVLALIFRPLVMECVDPAFLRSVSRAGGPAHLVFLALVVTTLVSGFNALGTLLSVGMMMLPAIAARFWAVELTGMIASATLIGLVSSICGLVLSFHTGLPSGPAIILVAGAFYLLSLLFGPQGGVVLKLLPQKHLEA
jgi:zinc/manganese transport system permease protein